MTPRKPDYYSQGGIELSDIIGAYNLGWYRGNVLKYLLRAGCKKKDTLLKDLLKARTYLDMKIDEIRRMNGTEQRAELRAPEEGQSQLEHIR